MSFRTQTLARAERAEFIATDSEGPANAKLMMFEGLSVNAQSWKVGLAGALLIASAAGHAAAEQGECPKVDAEANFKALGIAYYPPAPEQGEAHCESVRNGQLRSHLYRATEGYQRCF